VVVDTDASGTITLIEVVAGADEVRELQVPGYVPQYRTTLGATGHVNYEPPPGATEDTALCAGLRGEPCEGFRLPDGSGLVVNFGKKIGHLADWSLSEVILIADPDAFLRGTHA
jgi:hypothetical protein